MKIPPKSQANNQATPLRYGENPHQAGTFYGDLNALFDQLHGKQLSYNNLVDVDAAVLLMREFRGRRAGGLRHSQAYQRLRRGPGRYPAHGLPPCP